MKPTAVKHRKFKLTDVLYNDGEYSIVWGVWEGKQKRIAERWNGEGSDAGWPRQGNYPTWMIVTPALTTCRLKSLLDVPHANDTAIIKVLSELLSKKTH